MTPRALLAFDGVLGGNGSQGFLKVMREHGLATSRNGKVELLDKKQLIQFAVIDPIYSYGRHSAWMVDGRDGSGRE